MSERFEELKAKVLSLPFEPGVYIMKNRDGQVIYVGKAKALKNRVSQYFQSDSRHSPKTIRMVSNIWDFDIIVTETEFEALVLENQMIKKYQPKYNILLKDDKGYPFIKVTTSKPYPSFSIVAKPGHDADRYFGPYTSRRAAYHAIDTINETLKLKTCRRVFPRDIGKDRPCLNLHLGRCIAPCTGQVSAEEYAARVQEGISLLEGNDKALLADLTARMEQAAEDLRFEQDAARPHPRRARARRKAEGGRGCIRRAGRGCVRAGTDPGCVVAALSGVALHDKEFTLLDGVTAADAGEALGAFLKQYYALRGAVPRTVLLSSPIDESEAVGEFLSSIAERKVELAVPQRGRRHDIIRLAEKNAREEILRVETSQERRVKSLELLGQMTGMDELPHILEAYESRTLPDRIRSGRWWSLRTPSPRGRGTASSASKRQRRDRTTMRP
ncbi:MAG: excinuclease ABC subunit UvrC [Butyricicoccus pullicaecorum]